MQCMGNAGRGAHEASLDASRVITIRESVGKAFWGRRVQKIIVFTNNSTESLNIAIRGVLCPGDHVVTTMLEHNSVLRPLYAMEENGVELTIVSSDPSGNISYDEMEAAIRPHTKAIVCTNGSNLSGNMIDIARVGEIAKRHQVLLIVDASQTAGYIRSMYSRCRLIFYVLPGINPC